LQRKGTFEMSTENTDAFQTQAQQMKQGFWEILLAKLQDPDMWDVKGGFAAIGDTAIENLIPILRSGLSNTISNPVSTAELFENIAQVASSSAENMQGVMQPGNASQQTIVSIAEKIGKDFNALASEIRNTSETECLSGSWEGVALSQAAKLSLAQQIIGGLGAAVGIAQIIDAASSGDANLLGEKSAGVIGGYYGGCLV
jgi:hypothetical protein